MECNICGHKEFIDMNKRKKVKCSKCFSLERTRVIMLFLNKHKLIHSDSRVLHISPEKGLAEHLYKIAGTNCTFVDLDPKRYSFAPGIKKLDLCNDLDKIKRDSFDLIIHSHILEHIPCNYTYVLFQLHRILKPLGKIVCSIPILSGYFDSATSPQITENERNERFGQFDHITRFGRSDLNLSLGKVYNLKNDYDLTKTFSKEELLRFNIPEAVWRGYSPSSVLCLDKDDYLLK